jgi:hypothetical protein
MHLEAAGKLYPKAWKMSEMMRQDRGKKLPDWPQWCFMPLAGWYTIVSADAGVDRLPSHLLGDVSRLAALGAWRYTQGVYRFHPEIYGALKTTTLKGELPSEIFTRLPEWCVYIETPGMQLVGGAVFGFFIHLEHDAKDGRMELRFLMDTEQALFPYIMHLGAWTVEEAVQRTAREIQKHRGVVSKGLPSIPRQAHEAIQPYLSLVVYLCSQEPEYKGGRAPSLPRPKRTRKGWRLFPASHPRIWSVGHDTGEALSRARREGDKPPSSQATGRTRPEPHIRRAHWHGFWTGPRDGERRFEIRWLPPIPVNIDLYPDDAFP